MNIKTVDGNTTTNSITTTLPNGTVETETETAVKSGNVTTHTNVTTLPSGAVTTDKDTDFQKGHKDLIKDGSQPAADGAIDTYSGVKFTVVAA